MGSQAVRSVTPRDRPEPARQQPGSNDAIDRGLLTFGDFGDSTDEYLLPLYAVMGSAAMVHLCPELLPDVFG